MTGFNKNEIMKVLDGLSYEEKLLKIEEYVDICVAQNTIPIVNEYVYTHGNYFDQDLIDLYENYLNGLRDKNYYKIYDNLKHLNILLYEYLSKNGLFDEELNKIISDMWLCAKLIVCAPTQIQNLRVKRGQLMLNNNYKSSGSNENMVLI